MDDYIQERMAFLEQRIESLSAVIASLAATVSGIGNSVESSSDEATTEERTDPEDVMVCLEDGGKGAFRIETDDEDVTKIVDGYVMVGRTVVQADDFELGETSGSYCVHVSHPASSSTVTAEILNQAAQDNTDDDTYIPLFTMDSDGNITEDHRGMPCVPMYE